MNLKEILKALKLNESTISMILGALVIVVVALLVVNYFKDQKGTTLPFLQKEAEEQVSTEIKTHIVAKGENLWQIAEENYGSGYNWVDIAAENKLSDADQIEAGQRLILPNVEAKTQTIVEKSAFDTQTIAGANYTVVKGDSLWKIAVRAFGDGYKWVEIAKENNLDNPNVIHPGNVLTLPR